MEEYTRIITFNMLSAAEANRYTEELRDMLLDATPDIRVDRARENDRTQDVGTTLILFFGTPTAVSIAAAIGNWLRLRNSASLTIKTKEGQVIAKNLTSKDAAKLIEESLTKK